MSDPTISRADSLAGKRLLVTGGGSGIGLALAAMAVADGATVAATVRDPAEEARLRQALPAVIPVVADLADPARAEAAAREAIAALGGLDAAASVAGIFDHRAALDTDIAAWRATMAINLDATFVVAREAAAAMRAAGRGGALCLVSSQIGIVGHRRAGAYAASKAAVNGLVKALALELSADAIRVNAVAPGPIATPMTEVARADPARRAGLLAAIPLGRFGEAREVAAVIRFLLTDAAGFVTGQVWAVDGGVTAA